MMSRSRHRVQPGSSYHENRAEYLLERDYERLKGPTLRALRSKLRSRRMHFDQADLEGFYNQAWHALYVKVQGGERIEQLPGFLVQVTFYRAVDEYRRLHVADHADTELTGADGLEGLAADDDVDTRLDDARTLRELMEGMRDRLTEQEAAAATLCYFHGYSRTEAAEALGINERQIQRLMDTASKKIGAIATVIRAGGWCEDRESLIKAYALGILDPEGERHRLATEHLEGCAACRRYVLALRGLGAAMPPALLPLALATTGGGAAAVGTASAGKAGVGAGPRPSGPARTAGAVAVAAVILAVVATGVLAATGTFSGDDPPTRSTPAAAGSGAPATASSASSASSSSSASASASAAAAAKQRAARAEAARRRSAARKAKAKARAQRERRRARRLPPAPTPVAAPVPAPQPVPVAAPVAEPEPEPVTPPAPQPAPEPAPRPAPPREDGRQEFGVEADPTPVTVTKGSGGTANPKPDVPDDGAAAALLGPPTRP